MSSQRGILFAVPGTTCPEARVAFAQIERAALSRFPGVAVRWAYTSGPVRRKLVAQGIEAKSPADALAGMRAEGLTQVAVVSLHLTDGMEFGELAETVLEFGHQAGPGPGIALGHALMASESDWRRALAAMMAALPETPQAQDRVLLVAHGSQDPRAEKTLVMAAQVGCKVDSRLTLGMILGRPGRDEVVRTFQAQGVKKVWLVPCMVVAGYSARDEIAGAGGQSWATALRQAGLEVVPVVRGLGEIAGVVDIWMDQAESLLRASDHAK